MTTRSLLCAAVTLGALMVCGNPAHASSERRGTSSGDAGSSSGGSFMATDGNGRIGTGAFGRLGCVDAFGNRTTLSVSVKIARFRTGLELPPAATCVHFENDLERDHARFVTHRATLQSKMNGPVTARDLASGVTVVGQSFPHTCN